MNKFTASLVIALVIAAPLAARAETGDAGEGKKVFAKCAMCHTIGAGEKAKVGPNLHGLFSRISGATEGYAYSQAMKDAKIKWDEATLDNYLTKPQAVVKGTKMAFAGIPNPKDRANVIAYLEEASK